MTPSFEIPSALRDLEVPSDAVEGLYAHEVTVVENLSPDEVDQLVRGKTSIPLRADEVALGN